MNKTIDNEIKALEKETAERYMRLALKAGLDGDYQSEKEYITSARAHMTKARA